MKKVILFLVILLFSSGCSNDIIKVDGTVFYQDISGKTNYAKDQIIYMFQSGNEESNKLLNELKSKIDFQEYKENYSINALDESFFVLHNFFAFDSIITANKDKIHIYITTTNNFGNFTFRNIPSGNYYIFVPKWWEYNNYYHKTLIAGGIKYKEININKNMDKIIL